MSIKLEQLLSEPSDSEGVALFEALQHRKKYFTLKRKASKKKSRVSQPLPQHTKLKPKRKNSKKVK